MKHKQRPSYCSNLKGSTEIRKLNVTRDRGFSFAVQDITGTIGGLRMREVCILALNVSLLILIIAPDGSILTPYGKNTPEN